MPQGNFSAQIFNFVQLRSAMKKLILLLIFVHNIFLAKSQTTLISDDINIGTSEGYGIIGKYNDRVLFFNLDDNKVKLKSFDAKLHKIWEKDIEPDRKNSSKVLEVLGNRQDFNVIYHFRRKGHNFIKVHKYDAQVKLLDSAIVIDWGRNMVTPTYLTTYSEDKKIILVYEVESSNKINAVAISLDSLSPIWYKSFDTKTTIFDNNYRQVLINNNGDAFFIEEEDNRWNTVEKHRFVIRQINQYEDRVFQIPMPQYVNTSIKFKYDNVNQKMTAAGLYATKNALRSLGYYLLNISSRTDAHSFYYQPFDDEFVSSLFGKKITDNKGITDLSIQEIVHRRDGGILAIFEQVKEIERQMATGNSRFNIRGDGLRISVDYFYENIFAIALSPDGVTQWKSIFYKKQSSQDDEARYCSYFLVKTPTALRFLFNDEVERSTTVSEYMLNGSGQSERHAIMNTAGQDVNLRFRDAMQVSANEVIVPSDDRRRVKLVKIQY
jgi:hypothetical protein